jgi:hypothetical protein
MFGGMRTNSIVVALDYDPAADDDLTLWRAPQAVVITGAYATVQNDVAASTANYFNLALYNAGTSGTALTALAGTIGGTPGWTGQVAKTFTVSNGTVGAGEFVTLRYDETGTGTFTAMVVQLDYISGQQ